MPSIDIDQDTFDKLSFTAGMMNLPIGSVVRDLVRRVPQSGPSSQEVPTPVTSAAPPPPAGVEPANAWRAVYRNFKGTLVEGAFNPSTMEVRIDTAPWNGKVFSSPTKAGTAVVEHVSGSGVNPNTNGRIFWRLSGTKNDLRTIVGERFS